MLSRLATLAGQKDPKKNGDEMRAAVDSLTILGRPAVAPSLARLESSSDTEFRAGVARALVSICMSDCAKSDYNCIVPALLEGVTEALPSDVRMVSVRSLQTCTGQQLGDDPPAWRKWWADLKQRGASTAAR